jgi:hypothetical protein
MYHTHPYPKMRTLFTWEVQTIFLKKFAFLQRSLLRMQIAKRVKLGDVKSNFNFQLMVYYTSPVHTIRETNKKETEERIKTGKKKTITNKKYNKLFPIPSLAPNVRLRRTFSLPAAPRLRPPPTTGDLEFSISIPSLWRSDLLLTVNIWFWQKRGKKVTENKIQR